MSKKLFFLLPALLLGAYLILTPSCGDSDPCKDVDCGQTAKTGDCLDGSCFCNVGYEGATCSEKWTLKFEGSYTGYHFAGVDTFDLTTPMVIASVSESKIKLTNFLGQGNTSVIEGDVSLESTAATSAKKFVITSQKDVLNNTFAGDGLIDGKKLSGTFTLKQGSNTYTFKIAYSK